MHNALSTIKKVATLIAFALPLNAVAQDEINDLIKGSSADATKLVNAYLSPAFKGFGLGVNSAWATSAKTAGALRFDFRVTATFASSPTNDRSFNVNALNLQTLKPTNPANVVTPTITGANKVGVQMQEKTGSVPGTFNLPKGIGINYIPSPQVQLTFGLPQNIDISLRYAPPLDFKENGKLSLFGVGAKVEILPLILGKAGKILPVDVAIAGGYTKLNYELPLDVNNGTYTDQKLDASFGGYSAEAIVSKKLLFFTPFASVGYNTAQHKINALGTYEFNGVVEKDPIKIDEKSISGMKATVGFQLKLAIVKFYTSYTLAEYNYVNFGIGIGTGK